MHKRLLTSGAVILTVAAAVGVIPISPWDNDNVHRFVLIAAAVAWLSLVALHYADKIQGDNRELRLELDKLREYTVLSSILESRNAGQQLAIQPHGQIRPVSFNIGGENHLAGIDEDAMLAPVVDIAAALKRARRNGEAAS